MRCCRHCGIAELVAWWRLRLLLLGSRVGADVGRGWGEKRTGAAAAGGGGGGGPVAGVVFLRNLGVSLRNLARLGCLDLCFLTRIFTVFLFLLRGRTSTAVSSRENSGGIVSCKGQCRC